MVGISLLLLACGPGSEKDPSTGIPVINPLPMAPDATLIRFTVPSSETPSADIIGLPGAVTGQGEVTLVSSKETVRIQSTADGSFVASVDSSSDETVSLRFETSPQTTVSLQGRAPPGPGPDSIDGHVISIDGVARIRVETPLGATVVVANPSNGAVAVAVGEPSGDKSWATVHIAADPGDQVRAYVDGSPLSDPFLIPVR